MGGRIFDGAAKNVRTLDFTSGRDRILHFCLPSHFRSGSGARLHGRHLPHGWRSVGRIHIDNYHRNDANGMEQENLLLIFAIVFKGMTYQNFANL